MIELSVGMKCYASSLSLHIDGNVFTYRAPGRMKFAVILMTAEMPDNCSGIAADDFLKLHGYERKDKQAEQEGGGK